MPPPSPSPRAPPRQWLVTFFVVLNVLLLLLSYVDEADADAGHHRRKSRKDKTHAHTKTHSNTKTASYHRQKRARRPRHTHTHGAQFGAFLTVIKVVFFFSILPVVVYMVWVIASDPDTPRVAAYLYLAAQRRVYRAFGWPLPQQQAAVSVEPPKQGLEEEGTYFGDPLDAYNEDEKRKDR